MQHSTNKIAIWKKCDGRCHWCGSPLNLSRATIDHLRAIADGGTNAASNKVIACNGCNVRRSSRKSLEKQLAAVCKRLENVKRHLLRWPKTTSAIRALGRYRKEIAHIEMLLETHNTFVIGQ